jgi:predicted transposase/invertase (TIGR01784 family)
LEIPKLFDVEIERDENDPIVQWMEFLDAKSKGVMEMLAEKNKDIKKAYDLLQIISKDEKARMLYDARQAEISDQLTRIKSAEQRGMEKGREKGATEKALRVVEKMLRRGDSLEDIVDITELPMEKVLELKKKYQN